MGKCYLCACTFVLINRKGGRRNWCRGKTMPKLTLQRSKGQNDRKVSEITKRIIISVKRNSVESIRMLKKKITCGFSNTKQWWFHPTWDNLDDYRIYRNALIWDSIKHGKIGRWNMHLINYKIIKIIIYTFYSFNYQQKIHK